MSFVVCKISVVVYDVTFLYTVKKKNNNNNNNFKIIFFFLVDLIEEVKWPVKHAGY